MNAHEQSALEKATIKVRLIENGVLVSSGDGWFTFDSWEGASRHIKHRIDSLMATRAQAKLRQEAA